jgi:hypothetical protein
LKIIKWFFISFILTYAILGYFSVYLVSMEWAEGVTIWDKISVYLMIALTYKAFNKLIISALAAFIIILFKIKRKSL